jgi:phage terminase small subunit
MALIRPRDALLIGIGVAILGWAVLPPSALSIDETCMPVSGPAAVSAKLFPGTFWRKQLEAVVAERDDLLARPARRARIEAQVKAEASAIEGRMDRLSREQTRIDDRAEKERAEMAEQSARLKRLSWLMACEGEIRRRTAN